MTCCKFCLPNKKDVIYETNSFFVYVGKGIITAGHVMIIPKQHYLVIAEIDNSTFKEYLNLKNRVIKEITKKFEKPFLIEHGVFGQSVPHAHIHLIPASGNGYNNVNIINEMVLPAIKKLNIPFKKMEIFQNLKNIYNEDKQYMYFENNDDKYILRTKGYIKKEIRNDVIYRSFFTFKKNLSGVNGWKDMTDEDIELDNKKKRETISKLIL